MVIANYLSTLHFLVTLQGNLEFFTNEPIIFLHLFVRRQKDCCNRVKAP